MRYIKLRQANAGDAGRLFKWKNDRTVRKFSIKTNKKIKWKDHLVWLNENLKSVKIIEVNDVPCGDVRITDEIAIKIDPKYRGQGIGKLALELAKEGQKELTARIVIGNEPSMKLFLSAGFHITDFNGQYYTLNWSRNESDPIGLRGE